jgi:hypothetical protein
MKSPVRRLVLLLLAWGFVAAVAGSFHLIAHLPPAVVPMLVATMSVGLSVAALRVLWIRGAIASLGLRGIIAVHVMRFVGASFLWLQAQGRLPAEFAQRAGWGDIAAALGAVVLLLWPEGPGFRRALIAWNVFAMADLFVAVGTAGFLNATRAGSMAEIAAFPLALIPLWIVPVLMASHVVIFRVARRTAIGDGALARA